MPTVTGRATDFITFSRPGATGGGATVTDRDGKIKWAGHNLLTNSESFDASAWTKSSAPITANAASAPNGTTTADRANATATGDVYQSIALTAGVKYKLAIWAKSFGGTNQTFRLFADNNMLSSDFTATSSWQLFEFEFTAATGGASRACGVTNGVSNAAYDVLLWGAHLYRSDLGGMVLNPARGDAYYPTTPQNLIGYTEDWTNAAWVKTGLLAFGSGSTANIAVAPNGLQNADLITENTSNTEHFTTQVLSKAAVAGVYTASVYVKNASGSRNFAVAITDSTFGGIGTIFSTSGTIVQASMSVGVATGWTLNSYDITPVGNGWYRARVTATTNTASFVSPVFYLVDGTTRTYTGNGTSGVYIWGAEFSDSASLDAYSPVYGAAVTSAAYYAPRLDYSGSSLAALGLLVEEQRTNVLLHTAAFETTPTWTLTDVSVAANNAVAPDGTSTADTVTHTAASGELLQNNNTLNTAGTYSFSIFAKYTNNQWLRLTFANSATTIVGWFDVQNGIAGGSTGTGVVAHPPVAVGNGWYRLTLTGTVGTGSTVGYVSVIAASANNSNTRVNGGSWAGWGAQLEAGSFATSYIPTGASTATRTADVASVSTQAFPYNDVDGTVVVNFVRRSNSGNNWVWSTNAAFNDLVTGDANTNFRYGTSPFVDLTVSPQLTAAKVSAAYTRGGTHAISINGAAATTSGVSNVPTNVGAVLALGYDATTAGNRANIWIRQITYLPRRLSNAELQSRSA